jgi:hypothetical protein
MSPESPSMYARMRAGLAASMAWLAGGARRMEDWTGRRGRTLALVAVAGLILVAGALVVSSYGHSIAQEARGGRHAAEAHRGPHPKPAGKPGPAGKPERGGGHAEGPRGPRGGGPVAPPSGGPSSP